MLRGFSVLRAVDRYIIAAVLPYICMGFAILSVILLIQQSTKFAEVLGSTGAPLRLAFEVLIDILPGVLIFSIPVAVLVGTATGFSRMGHDSELTAIGAAGVGDFRVIAPAFFQGLLFSLLALYISFNVAPAAAQNLRDIALQAALYKIGSPVEPRSFYTGIPGKVIYIREGNKQEGEWEKIFIHWQEPDGQVRLVTAKSGRLDFAGSRAELVLEEAVVTTLPAGGGEAIEKGEHVTIEHSHNMRLRDDRLNFGRDALTKRMHDREPELDELGWSDLLKRASITTDVKHQREAEISLNKRLTFGLSPMLFAFFGACLGLKVVRGGRSQGILLSLVFMLLYYLVSLAGEQLARAGTITPVFGCWLPFGLSVTGGGFLLAVRRRAFGNPFGAISLRRISRIDGVGGVSSRKRISSFLGLIDKAIFWSLIRNFLQTLSVLLFVFQIFTVSELLRFIASNNIGTSLVLLYLIYLIPFAFMVVTPVATLVSVLITFAIMVKRNETIAWWASGQSVFRLAVPCIFFAAILGISVWLIQDKVMPVADRKQNVLRNFIRTGASLAEIQSGRIWIASPDARHLYAYDSSSVKGRLSNLELYNFDSAQTDLASVTISQYAFAITGAGMALRDAEVINLEEGGVAVTHNANELVPEAELGPLNDQLKVTRASEFDFNDLSAYISDLKSRGIGVRALEVALERRRVEPFFPLVMTLAATPLALMFGRKGTLVAICVAIGAGLLFLGVTNIFQELGAREILSAPVAIWTPSILFLGGGIYLLSRTQT